MKPVISLSAPVGRLWVTLVVALVYEQPVFSISFGHPYNQMRCLIIKFLILTKFCPETPV
jgi:hypothetical protein